jgi:hypothetical protein
MVEPKDRELYEKVRKKVYRDMPTHSAYRSAILVKTYKSAYGRKYGNADLAYIGAKPTKKVGLGRWLAEEWRNQRGEVGYKYKSDIYRPTKRITAKTPTTIGELSNSEIKTARELKRKTGRVNKFKKSESAKKKSNERRNRG